MPAKSDRMLLTACQQCDVLKGAVLSGRNDPKMALPTGYKLPGIVMQRE